MFKEIVVLVGLKCEFGSFINSDLEVQRRENVLTWEERRRGSQILKEELVHLVRIRILP